jgi:hypothetical protein
MSELVNRTTGEVLDLGTLDGLARAIGTLDTDLQDVAARLDELAGGTEGPVTAWCWRDIGPIGAAVLWKRLAFWVGWLRARYPVAEQLPACWWRHPELIEELTALYLAWRAAYTDPAAHLTAPADWHDRWLPGTLARVRSWGVYCDGDHRDRPAAAYDLRAVDDQDAFTRHVDADLHARRESMHIREELPMPSSATVDVIPATEIAAHLAAGAAHSLGGLPGSPVRYDGAYWRADGDAYVRITDPTLVERLRVDEERLRLADDAVQAAREREEETR